jgi:hypothetical protein
MATHTMEMFYLTSQARNCLDALVLGKAILVRNMRMEHMSEGRLQRLMFSRLRYGFVPSHWWRSLNAIVDR